jgi:hypothetical protein
MTLVGTAHAIILIGCCWMHTALQDWWLYCYPVAVITLLFDIPGTSKRGHSSDPTIVVPSA